MDALILKALFHTRNFWSLQ